MCKSESCLLPRPYGFRGLSVLILSGFYTGPCVWSETEFWNNDCGSNFSCGRLKPNRRHLPGSRGGDRHFPSDRQPTSGEMMTVAPTAESCWAGKRKTLVPAGRQRELFGRAQPTLYEYCIGLWDILIKITHQLDVERNKTSISKSGNIQIKEFHGSCKQYNIMLSNTVVCSGYEEEVEVATTWWEANNLMIEQLETALEWSDRYGQGWCVAIA